MPGSSGNFAVDTAMHEGRFDVFAGLGPSRYLAIEFTDSDLVQVLVEKINSL